MIFENDKFNLPNRYTQMTLEEIRTERNTLYNKLKREKTMTIGDLIKDKDYDYVSYRLRLADGGNIFAGCFASKDGEIISLDGDTYGKYEEVLRYKEWSEPEEGIKNGLTVVVKGE